MSPPVRVSACTPSLNRTLAYLQVVHAVDHRHGAGIFDFPPCRGNAETVASAIAISSTENGLDRFRHVSSGVVIMMLHSCFRFLDLLFWSPMSCSAAAQEGRCRYRFSLRKVPADIKTQTTATTSRDKTWWQVELSVVKRWLACLKASKRKRRRLSRPARAEKKRIHKRKLPKEERLERTCCGGGVGGPQRSRDQEGWAAVRQHSHMSQCTAAMYVSHLANHRLSRAMTRTRVPCVRSFQRHPRPSTPSPSLLVPLLTCLALSPPQWRWWGKKCCHGWEGMISCQQMS